MQNPLRKRHVCPAFIIGQETDPAAPAEFTFFSQFEQDVQAVKCLKNVLSPLMVILKTFLVHILVGYGFVNTSSEGFGGKSHPLLNFYVYILDFLY